MTLQAERGSGPHQLPLPRWFLAGLLRAVILFLATHAALFAMFDLLPSTELKLAGWTAADPAATQRYREAAGLGPTTPAFERYLKSVRNLFRGELGRTVSGFQVSQILRQRALRSLPTLLAGLFFSLSIPCALALWRLQPTQPPGWVAWRFLSVVGTIPAFLFGTLIKSGIVLTGIDQFFFSNPLALNSLLGFIGAALPAAVMFSVMSSAAENLMQQPFVMAARAKGLSKFGVRMHLVPNMIVVLRPLLGRCWLMLMGGVLFAEVVFDVPGWGRLFMEALQAADYTLLQAWMLSVALIVYLVSGAEGNRV